MERGVRRSDNKDLPHNQVYTKDSEEQKVSSQIKWVGRIKFLNAKMYYLKRNKYVFSFAD